MSHVDGRQVKTSASPDGCVDLAALVIGLGRSFLAGIALSLYLSTS